MLFRAGTDLIKSFKTPLVFLFSHYRPCKRREKRKALWLTKSLSFSTSDVTVAVQLMSELLNFEFVRSLDRLHVTLVQD